MTIRTLQDLMDYFCAETPNLLNKRVYKGTSCGAHISVYTPDGKDHHCGQDWSGITEITAFLIGTIVEGCDFGVEGEWFELPCESEDVDKWMEEMESQADFLWKNANYDWFVVRDGIEYVTSGQVTWDGIEFNDDENTDPAVAAAVTAAINAWNEANPNACWDEEVKIPVEVGGKTLAIEGYIPENF